MKQASAAARFRAPLFLWRRVVLVQLKQPLMSTLDVVPSHTIYPVESSFHTATGPSGLQAPSEETDANPSQLAALLRVAAAAARAVGSHPAAGPWDTADIAKLLVAAVQCAPAAPPRLMCSFFLNPPRSCFVGAKCRLDATPGESSGIGFGQRYKPSTRPPACSLTRPSSGAPQLHCGPSERHVHPPAQGLHLGPPFRPEKRGAALLNARAMHPSKA